MRNRRKINILSILILIITIPFSSFSQCFEEANVDYQIGDPTLGFLFQSADTGYMLKTYFPYEDIVYLWTVDSGKNWVCLDTTLNFFPTYNKAPGIYNYNTGIISGKRDGKAAIEVFHDDFMLREFQLIPELNEIVDMCFVS